MAGELSFYPDAADAGTRLDAYLAQEMETHTRSAAARLIAAGKVTVGGGAAKAGQRLKPGDVVCVSVPEAVPPDILPEDIPLDVLYEDEHLIVVNKPQGMVVHPAPGHFCGTLVNALMYHCNGLSGINGVMRPGIVHRIDRDTSGVLVAAKTDAAHHGLAAQLAEHSMLRRYHALARHSLKADSGTIDAPIGRHPTERKKMAVTKKNGKPAVTHYRVLGRYKGYTHIEARLETGRTHQIRVHMAYIGHPLLGDPVYGKADGLNGQALHAQALGFVHPQTGRRMLFESPLPDYFTRMLN